MEKTDLPQVLAQLNNAFRHLEPSPETRRQLNAQATLIRQALRARLKKCLIRDFVGGSFGRATVLAPVKDLDIFLMLDPERFFPGGIWEDPLALLEHLKREAELAFGKPDQSAGELKDVSPEALRCLAQASLRLQEHSVGIQLPGEGVWFELVPLLPHKSLSDKLVIPDRGRKNFILTDPETQYEVMKQAAKKMGGALNRYIRLIKAWNRAHGQLYKSFYLEVMCYDAFQGNPPDMLTGFETLATHLCARVLQKQPDPTGAGPHIDDAADTRVRQERQAMLQKLVSDLAQVQALRRIKEPAALEQAHRLMRGVLGKDWGV